jgi:cytochrome c oxidase subunit 4
MSHVHMVKGPKVHAHSVWLYWGVFFALVCLTLATVFFAQYDFGKLNLIVMLLIAGTKAALVLSVFMHLAFDNRFFTVILGSSLIFLSLFIVFAVLDEDSREDVDMQSANFVPRNEAVFKHKKDKPNALPLRPSLQEAQEDKLIMIGPGEH